MKPVQIILRTDTKLTDLHPVLRDLHALASGGTRIDSQMAGEVRSCLFNRSHPPVLSTTLTKPPAMVMCMRARLSDGTGPQLSHLPVSWTWGGTATKPTITISDLVGAAAGTDYDVTLWISEG
jgi:hypothetical protein